MSIANKVILITGASSGIGAACAECFAKEGALLALVGRDADKFKKVLKKIKENGVESEPLIILADICTDSQQIMAETIEKYSRLDILINSAGCVVPGSAENTRIEDFDTMMATNVRGTLMLTQLAIPHLIATKGNIINVSSAASLRPFGNLLGYCMSKAALDQFTRCMALELAEKGVRVNSINPGGINSFSDSNQCSSEQRAAIENYAKLHPIGRLGRPEECVIAISLLASDKAGFITGAILPIDGGMSVQNVSLK